jgi:small-conductance mechanosensitive channel
VYDTPTVKLKKIPQILREIIEKQDFVTYEWAYLYELNAYSVDYFISYDIEQPDYLLSLDIHEMIMFGMLEAFEKEGISFAYPTQTIHTPDIMTIKK